MGRRRTGLYGTGTGTVGEGGCPFVCFLKKKKKRKKYVYVNDGWKWRDGSLLPNKRKNFGRLPDSSHLAPPFVGSSSAGGACSGSGDGLGLGVLAHMNWVLLSFSRFNLLKSA